MLNGELVLLSRDLNSSVGCECGNSCKSILFAGDAECLRLHFAVTVSLKHAIIRCYHGVADDI